MEKYYHEPDAIAYQYQVLSITKEMKFRLGELIDTSRMELSAFYNSSKTKKTHEPTDLIKYRFSSVLALLQTFRDALPKAIGNNQNLKSLASNVPHAKVLRQLRNSLVHDGYQPFGLWVDGRYYMGTNYIAHDQYGKSIRVDAPEVDIETLALEYLIEYCAQLATLLADLPENEKLIGSPRSYEWFQATYSHPVLQRFPEFAMPSRFDGLVYSENEPSAIDGAVINLRAITELCAARLSELENLPLIPWS